MLELLYPKMYFDRITQVPIAFLQEKKIKAFILDLDNTITEWNSLEIDKEVNLWLESTKAIGFKLCILSNNNEARIIPVAQKLDIPYVAKAKKPSRRGFKQALEILQLSAEEVAIIGDQIFTDILGGNRSKIFTILLKPINKAEFSGTKISRIFEYFILKDIPKTKL